MTQLWMLRALCAALCAFAGATSEIQYVAARTKFNITRTEFTNSWQSSEIYNRCFRDTAIVGRWDYFHTTNIPDSHGYQWLLIKLSRAIRVKSVTVYGRATVSNRAENIEILLSDRLPTGLDTSSGGCYATLSDSLSSFTQCGVTKKEDSRTHRIYCQYSDCTNMTEYILLRKDVRNETDKYMNFEALEVQEASQTAQIYKCQTSGSQINDCGLNDLQLLKNGDTVPMKICPSCQLQATTAAACYISLTNGNIMQLEVKQHRDSSLITWFTSNSTTQGGNFTCHFSCFDGTSQTATESIGYTEEKPKHVFIQPSNAVQIGSKTFLATGTDFLFSFITEEAYPNPIHTCKLMSTAEQTTTEDTSGVLLHPIRTALTEDATSKSHTSNLTSEYRLNISADIIGNRIQCVSTLPRTDETTTKSMLLPEVVEPSKTEFGLPTNSNWKDGGTVRVAVDSSNGSRVATSHSCYLETRDNNRSLTATSVSNTSSEFDLSVDRRWGNSSSLVCLVNQSGLIETWARRRLPKVLYKAEGLAINLQSMDLLHDEETSFSVTASDIGYPSALHQCRIGRRSLGQDKTPQSDGSSQWSFTPLLTNNGDQIRCYVLQKLNDILVFNQTVNSSALNVKYKANVTWPSSSTQEVKEGESVSVHLFADGNPEPSSQCWMQLTSGSSVNLSLTKRSEFDVSFNLTAVRSMNGGNLTCLVTQAGLQHPLDQWFTQAVKVFYQPRPPLSIDLVQTVYGGTSLNFTVRSGDGNPSVTHSCHANSGTIKNLSRSTVGSEYFTVMEYTPNRNDSFVNCTAVQTHDSKVVFKSSTEKNISVNYIALNYMEIRPTERVFAGNRVEVNLTSFGGRPAVGQHECLLGGSIITMENKTMIRNGAHFVFNAQKEHNQKLLACKFIQDEHLSGWRNRSISVFYKATVDSTIKLRTRKVRANSTVEFLLIFSDLGNPPAEQNCSIGSRRLTAVTPASTSNMSSSWKFKTEVNDNGKEITCQVVQRDPRGRTAFAQTVSSQTLNVLYPADLSHFLTVSVKAPVVREGELLNVSFLSVGGNPEPTHHCWLLAPGGRTDTVSLETLRIKQLLETNFSVKSTRQMNGGSVVCQVSQEGLEDLAKNYYQNISVFFQSVVNLTGSKISGTTVVVGINVTDGNPTPHVNCSLLSSSMSRHEVATNVSATFSVGQHFAHVYLDSAEQSQSVNITCSVKQDYDGFRNNSFFFKEVKLDKIYNPEDQKERGTVGGAVGASFGSLLAVALVVAAILLLLRARRLRRQTDGLGGGAGSSPNGTSGTGGGATRQPRKKRDDFQATELQFMERHYLYPKPRMEYATVVKGELVEPGLADSTETIYLTIVGCAQSEDDGVQTPKAKTN